MPATEFLVEHGYDEHYGARPLKRAIQRYIEDPLSREDSGRRVRQGRRDRGRRGAGRAEARIPRADERAQGVSRSAAHECQTTGRVQSEPGRPSLCILSAMSRKLFALLAWRNDARAAPAQDATPPGAVQRRTRSSCMETTASTPRRHSADAGLVPGTPTELRVSAARTARPVPDRAIRRVDIDCHVDVAAEQGRPGGGGRRADRAVGVDVGGVNRLS